MRSHIYVLSFVLSLVLFQAGCCVLPTYMTLQEAEQTGIALIVNQADFYGEANDVVHIGSGIELYTSSDIQLDEIIAVGVTLPNDNNPYRGKLSLRQDGVILQEFPAGLQLYGTISEIRVQLSQLHYAVPSNANTAYSQTINTGFSRNNGSVLGNSVRQFVHTEGDPIPPTATSVPQETGSVVSPSNQNNIAPTNTVPGTQGVTHRQPHVMNFLVDDPDIGNNSLNVTLQVNKGTLTVIPADGVTVGGNGTGTVTITGTLNAVNQTLLGADGGSLSDGVVYHYTGDHLPEGANTTDNLTFTSRDNIGAVSVNFVELQVSNPIVAPTVVPPTSTMIPPTATATATFTATATATETFTATPVTPTATSTATFTATPITPTATSTATFTATPVTPTATATPTFTATAVPPTAVICVEIDTVYFLSDNVFMGDDLNFDLLSGVTDADAVPPFTFSASGLPNGFMVNGNILYADQMDVYQYGISNPFLVTDISVTDQNGCTGQYELTLEFN